MKKRLTLFTAFIFMTVALFSQTIKSGSKITVSLPIVKNADASEEWLSFFVQGQLLSDIQNYSDFAVIDRTAAETLLGEQKLKETNAFINEDESSSIQYANLVDSDYLVVVNLLKKSSNWSFDCKILDVKTSNSVGKSYSNANVMPSMLEDGSVIHTAAYELLKSLGVEEKRLSQLTKQTQTQLEHAAAQLSLAKGIVAEQKGTNIEALTYYIQAHKNDNRLVEATSKMQNMTSAVTGGNFGESAKNLMKLRDDWDKLFKETAIMLSSNPPSATLAYYSDIQLLELTEENYNNKTISLRLSYPDFEIADYEDWQIVDKLLYSFVKIPESKNWGAKINGFPFSYGEDCPEGSWIRTKENNYYYNVDILDENKDLIARNEIKIRVEYCDDYNISKVSLKNGKRPITLAGDTIEKMEEFRIRRTRIDNGMEDEFGSLRCGIQFLRNDNSKERDYLGRPIVTKKYIDYIDFMNIPVNNADTSKFFVEVTQTQGEKTSIISFKEYYDKKIGEWMLVNPDSHIAITKHPYPISFNAYRDIWSSFCNRLNRVYNLNPTIYEARYPSLSYKDNGGIRIPTFEELLVALYYSPSECDIEFAYDLNDSKILEFNTKSFQVGRPLYNENYGYMLSHLVKTVSEEEYELLKKECIATREKAKQEYNNLCNEFLEELNKTPFRVFTFFDYNYIDHFFIAYDIQKFPKFNSYLGKLIESCKFDKKMDEIKLCRSYVEKEPIFKAEILNELSKKQGLKPAYEIDMRYCEALQANEYDLHKDSVLGFTMNSKILENYYCFIDTYGRALKGDELICRQLTESEIKLLKKNYKKEMKKIMQRKIPSFEVN